MPRHGFQVRRLWTVEWDKDYPQFQIKANWAVVRSLKDAFKLTNKLGAALTPITPEEFARENGMSVEEALASMLPVWSSKDGEVRITEYTEESAGPMRWKMFMSWLAAYHM